MTELADTLTREHGLPFSPVARDCRRADRDACATDPERRAAATLLADVSQARHRPRHRLFGRASCATLLSPAHFVRDPRDARRAGAGRHRAGDRRVARAARAADQRLAASGRATRLAGAEPRAQRPPWRRCDCATPTSPSRRRATRRMAPIYIARDRRRSDHARSRCGGSRSTFGPRRLQSPSSDAPRRLGRRRRLFRLDPLGRHPPIAARPTRSKATSSPTAACRGGPSACR